jgi:predicted MFS family arabinose efflux permease
MTQECLTPPTTPTVAPGGPAPLPARRGRHRAWWVAAAAALALVTAGAFSTMPGLLVGPLQHEFGWSHGAIGFAVWANMALNGLTAPFAAALMDRFGLRRVTVAALVATAAGAGLTTVMDAVWQLSLYWGVLVGLGTGALATAFAASVTHRWFVARRGLVTGVLTAAGVFGQFAFLPLLSWVVEQHHWRTALATLALAALAVVPVAWLLLRDHPTDLGIPPYGARRPTPRPAPAPGAAGRTVRVFVGAARTRELWLLAGAFAVCGASTNGIMWTHFTPAAHEHGMPVTVASSLLSVIGVFNVAGTVASGWLTDRVDPRRLLAGYFALRGGLLAALPWLLASTVQPSMVFFVVAFGLLDVATVPPVVALCRRRYGDDSPVVFGWVVAAHQVGAGLMAYGGGVIRDTLGGYDPVWVAAAGLCALTVVLVTGLSSSSCATRPGHPG